MEFTERSLIIKVGRFREIDLWVRLATPSRGVFTAFAFGGSKSRRRFLGCLDPLNHVLFRFKKSPRGEYLYLMEGTLISGHPHLRSNQRMLGRAANCLKFYESVYEGPGDSRQGFELLSEALSVLEAAVDSSPMFPVLFRAKVAFTQGYGPALLTCPHCGKDLRNSVAPMFLVEQGQVACTEHIQGSGRRIPLGTEALDILRIVKAGRPEDWHALEPSPVARRQLYDIVDGIVRYHLGLAWEDGRFQRI
ncbi:DNA repair protein RecO [Desulfovibrio ferrophilus]|uniref:DNA repair protein RecO n=1 Tax=Desulfovibrio ferrophilus TaxID=241368 RepID=A0A2Z6AWM3_9BACT|nr:DNA repair protein RecO [Desulfovibrio ferrophilus]BBD07620.1 DNA repair protein RecO [Desulfovibrio ferrophilus]